MRDLGLVGELFRDDLVGENEWWILDLSRKLGVIPQKVHYWVKQGWVHVAPHAVREALDCLGGSGRDPAASEAGEAEELLDRRPSPGTYRPEGPPQARFKEVNGRNPGRIGCAEIL